MNADRPHSEELRALFHAVQAGKLSADEATATWTAATSPAASATVGDFAVVDHDRATRCGFPEVVFGQGKSSEQVVEIVAEILSRSPRALVTRGQPDQFAALATQFPDTERDPIARCARIERDPQPTIGRVAIVAAGTSDLPIAAEAEFCLRTFGVGTERFLDVGVAGIHRLFDRLPAIRRCDLTIAIAGMEGALPSVLAGQLDHPVLAVPTSIGYGANFHGLAPLLTMLNSCAAGIAVVNIDAGFSAAYVAAQIVRRRTGARVPNPPQARSPAE